MNIKRPARPLLQAEKSHTNDARNNVQKNTKVVSGATWASFKTIGLVGLMAISALGSFAQQAAALEIVTPKTVVELFTSQGCSSCPPADRLLKRMSKDDEVLALAWHVDYWDYLGWKDSFASPEFSDRQRQYARAMNERNVYTPQMVVNGQDHAIGSRETDIKDLIKSHLRSGGAPAVPIEVTRDGQSLHIRVPKHDGAKGANLWLVYYNSEGEVSIARGENRGETISYTNIVRDVELVGMMMAEDMTATLPIQQMAMKGFDNCALVLQKTTAAGHPGAIVGAVVIKALAE